MPDKTAMAERSRDWIAQAERDVHTARWLAQGGLHEWACFICQQAAEKATKAVYQKLGGEAWGYAVAALLEGMKERVQVPDDLPACGQLLDHFYIPARSPNSWDAGSPKDYYAAEDVERALGCAEAVLRFC